MISDKISIEKGFNKKLAEIMGIKHWSIERQLFFGFIFITFVFLITIYIGFLVNIIVKYIKIDDEIKDYKI